MRLLHFDINGRANAGAGDFSCFQMTLPKLNGTLWRISQHPTAKFSKRQTKYYDKGVDIEPTLITLPGIEK